MAKSIGQKAKLVLILKYLEEFTDENHIITTSEIKNKLEQEGISCDRKTIYSDIEALCDLGYEILKEPSRNGGGYKLISRNFELPELKLLVDAVQSSRFITSKKSKELITKIETLTSKYEAARLHRNVYVASRIKSENESIFYTIDFIQTAIQEGKQISFTYLEWNSQKKLVPRGEGKRIISPWALIWKEENYYLLAYDDIKNDSRHFRIDKITDVKILDKKRVGENWFNKLDMAVYADTTFSMMGGKPINVVLDFPEKLVGVVIDRFGKDVTIKKVAENKVRVRAKVLSSSQLYGWITGLSNDIVIVSPDNIREEYIKWLKNLITSNENL